MGEIEKGSYRAVTVDIPVLGAGGVTLSLGKVTIDGEPYRFVTLGVTSGYDIPYEAVFTPFTTAATKKQLKGPAIAAGFSGGFGGVERNYPLGAETYDEADVGIQFGVDVRAEYTSLSKVVSPPKSYGWVDGVKGSIYLYGYETLQERYSESLYFLDYGFITAGRFGTYISINSWSSYARDNVVWYDNPEYWPTGHLGPARRPNLGVGESVLDGVDRSDNGEDSNDRGSDNSQSGGANQASVGGGQNPPPSDSHPGPGAGSGSQGANSGEGNYNDGGGQYHSDGYYDGVADDIANGGVVTSLPTLLDLSGNGIELTQFSDSTRFVDFNGDGLKNRTSWAAPGDGVQFFDADGDGAINEAQNCRSPTNGSSKHRWDWVGAQGNS